MKLKTLALAVCTTAIVAGPAAAELVFPTLDYRTGPYGPGGIPFADGYADYMTLLQERDGGIGGEPIRLVPCETGYNTERGVECYESTKGEGALVYQPLSTGITYQLIPKATADNIPIHSLGYGRTSAANGEVFSHVFNYPANYWDAASGIVNFLLEENDGDLEGKSIALVYHDSSFGAEPIRTLQMLSEKHGFELSLKAVSPPGNEQRSTWLEVRRERPDFVIMWGWGVQNSVAIQEAVNIRYPMNNFYGAWWSVSENDVIPAGEGADGYRAVMFHGVGSDYPVYDDIQEYVLDAGLAAGAGDQVGTVLYNRGMYAAMLTAEAVRTAQEIPGDDARRNGSAGDRRGEDGGAGSAGLRYGILRLLRGSWWAGQFRDCGMGRGYAILDDDLGLRGTRQGTDRPSGVGRFECLRGGEQHPRDALRVI